MITSSIWLPKNNSLSSILQLIHKTYPGGYSIWFCYLKVNLPLFFSHELLCHLSFNLKHLFTHPSNKYLLSTVCCCCCLVAKLCPTLSYPMDCSPPGSSVHGISQARILEWVAVHFSRGSSQSRDRIQVSLITGVFFTI